MRIKTLLDYGLRIVIFLAMHDGTCPSHEIAQATGIPRDYLIQIAQLLRKGNIIKATAGKHGGYQLARPANKITIYEIMSALENQKDPDQSNHMQQDPQSTTSVMKRILSAINTVALSQDAYMDSITVQAIIDNSLDIENIDTCFSDLPKENITTRTTPKQPYL